MGRRTVWVRIHRVCQLRCDARGDYGHAGDRRRGKRNAGSPGCSEETLVRVRYDYFSSAGLRGIIRERETRHNQAPSPMSGSRRRDGQRWRVVHCSNRSSDHDRRCARRRHPAIAQEGTVVRLRPGLPLPATGRQPGVDRLFLNPLSRLVHGSAAVTATTPLDGVPLNECQRQSAPSTRHRIQAVFRANRLTPGWTSSRSRTSLRSCGARGYSRSAIVCRILAVKSASRTSMRWHHSG